MRRLLALLTVAVLSVALLPVLPAAASSAAEFEQCVIDHFKKTGLSSAELDNTPRATLRNYSAKVHAHLANGGSTESIPKLGDNVPTAVDWVYFYAQPSVGMTLVEYSKEERCQDFRSQFRWSGSALNQFDYYAVGAYVTTFEDPEVPDGLYSIKVTFAAWIAAPAPTTTTTTTPSPSPTTTAPTSTPTTQVPKSPTTTLPVKPSTTTLPVKPSTPSKPVVTPSPSAKTSPDAPSIEEPADSREAANQVVGITPETEAANHRVLMSRVIWSQLRAVAGTFAGLCSQERTTQISGPFCALTKMLTRFSDAFAPAPLPHRLRVM